MQRVSIIKDMQRMGLKIGSFRLTTRYDDKTKKIMKVPEFICEGTKRKSPCIVDDKKYNAYWFETGKENNVMMVDLDDLNDARCLKIKELADKCAKAIVKTRKGYHYYFEYTDDFPKCIGGLNTYGIPIDIRSKGGIVYCPPTKYKSPDEKETYEYRLIKSDGIVPMSDELKKYMLSIFKIDKPKEELKIIDHDTQPLEDQIMVRLIHGLSPNRSIKTESWVDASYCFKNSGYSLEYFDLFSKLHYTKYDASVVKQHYKRLTVRKDGDKKKTEATLWLWLKEDDNELFEELCNAKYSEKYKIIIKPNEKMSYEKLCELIEKDEKELKKFFYITFGNTRSFKYFNHFHVYHIPHATIYNVGEIEPIAYKQHEIAGMYITNPFTGRDVNFVEMWEHQKNKKIRLIHEFIFNPDPDYVDKQDKYNLFKGFDYEVIDYDDAIVKIYIDHVKRLCCEDAIVYNYLLDWIAHIFQFPHIKIGTAIFMYSDTNGTGKNLTFDVISKLLGNYFLQLSSTTGFAEHFNGHHANKLLCFTDEISARMRELDNELKNIVTRPKIPVTYKGKDTFYIDDLTNYVFSTNNESVIRMSCTDRRWMIIHTTETKMTKEQINMMVGLKDDRKALQHLFSYFMRRDLSHSDLHDIPMTEYKKELVINDFPAYIKMFQMEPDIFMSRRLDAKQIYAYSLTFARDKRLPQSYTFQKCAKDTHKIFKTLAKKENNINMYYFPVDFNKKVDDLIEQAFK